MKTPATINAHCGEKARPSVRLHPVANRQKSHRDSGQPMPAVRAQNEFTIEEHLRVQQEIEERAHRFWLAKGCALIGALDDWLKVENEVLAEFVKTRMQRHSVQPASSEAQTKIGGTSSLLPAMPLQSPALSKLKSMSVRQYSL